MPARSPDPLSLAAPKATTQLFALAGRARETVPYYRASLAEVDFGSPSLRLADLPLLSKELARAAQADLVRPGYTDGRQDVIVEHTSGSTGIPLRLIRTRAEVLRGARALWRLRSEIFPDVMSAPGVQVSASPLITDESPTDRTVVLSAFDLRPDRIDRYLDALDACKPVWLRGHPAVLAVLAEGLRRTRRRLGCKLAFIESNSGWLSFETRNLLAETFDCKVVEHYGTRETYTIAYECPAGTMHLLDDCVVAELLPHPEAHATQLVASSLIFEVMPFIRYQVGDWVEAEASACVCGKASPALRPAGGRGEEMIAGTVLLGTYVFHVVVTQLARSGVDQIMQYQVIQTGIDRFDVRLVLEEPERLNDVAGRFRKEATAILPDAQFCFEALDHIAPTRAGKVQAFVRGV